ALTPTAHAVPRGLHPNLPVQKPMPQRAQFEESYWRARLFTRLSIFFGVIAVLLVATGLYGTLAYRVDRRTSEIGVRMALGAQHGQVLWLILRESLLVSGAAILAGVPVAIAGARLMRSMLFGVQPSDMISFLLALFGVILVSLAASIISARRAMRVDPMVALRYA